MGRPISVPAPILSAPSSNFPTPLLEGRVWKNIDGIWKPLFGGFATHGVSIEWHEFQIHVPMAWSRSFHPNSLEICLNYTGGAELQEKTHTESLQNKQIAIYTFRDELIEATRQTGPSHRFITIELAPEYLARQFTHVLDNIKPEVVHFLEKPDKFAPWIQTISLPVALLGLRQQLLHPPVSQAAFSLWYAAKIQEVIAQTLFQPDKVSELFCHRHKRVNAERVEQAKFLLERDLSNPPSLEMLSQEVDCSPFYLSRLFAEHLGTSIPKFLRDCRIEKAADLIKQGESSTSAAMSVGYSSLSAFNKAFLARFGQPPGKYRESAL